MPSQKRKLHDIDFPSAKRLFASVREPQKRSLDINDGESEVPAKRQATKAAVSLPLAPALSNRKRRTDDIGDDDTPHKRGKWQDEQATKAAVSLPLAPALSNRKQPADDTGDDDDTPQKRVKWQDEDDFFFNQKARMAIYQILQTCETWNDYHPYLNMAYKESTLILALALIDSPEELRLKALNVLNDDIRSLIINLISRIQEDKDRFDPKGVFPTVITRELVGMNLSAISCNICNGGFVEGNDVVLKNCGNHLLHLKCFRDSVTDGEMPLLGPCECI